MFIICMILWIGVLFYDGFSHYKVLELVEGGLFLEPEEIKVYRNRFYLIMFLILSSVIALVLILNKRYKGWQMALVNLIVGVGLGVSFVVSLWGTWQYQFFLLSEGVVYLIPVSIYFLHYVATTFLLPCLMLWLMWYLKNRGVFKRSGVI